MKSLARSLGMNSCDFLKYTFNNQSVRATKFRGNLFRSHKVITHYTRNCVLADIGLKQRNTDRSFFKAYRGFMKSIVTFPELQDGVGSTFRYQICNAEFPGDHVLVGSNIKQRNSDRLSRLQVTITYTRDYSTNSHSCRAL